MKVPGLHVCFVLMLCASHGVGAPVLEIEQVLVDGQPVGFSSGHEMVLPAGRHDLEIRFRTQADTPPGWIVEYQLAGHDATWRTVDGEMALTLRMLDGANRELSSARVPVAGQTLNWPAVQTRASLTRRLRPMVVPAGAKFLEMTFDSGTWRPELTGEWVIAEVTVNRASQTFGPTESFWQNPLLEPVDPLDLSKGPRHWEQRGDAHIAKYKKAPPPPKEPGYVLTLRDFSKSSGGAWRSRQALPPEVKAGEVLTIGWWDRSRVGDERSHAARYDDVPPGRMVFRAVGRGAGAVYQSQDIQLPILIRPYLWTQPWFAPTAVLGGAVVVAFGVWQWARRKYRRKLARLESDSRIGRDRMRIARDIHDDVGAQLTRLGLMCAAVADGATPTQVEEIALASRRVVQSMDEIVWAIEPGNDSLDQLGTYLCRFTDEFLEDSGVRPRYDVPVNLPAMPLSAEVRHNLFLATKEALNNSVKYAAAREIWLTLAVAGDQGEEAVEITVADDGTGFDIASAEVGHGLRNMRTRLEEIGGSCRLESTPGLGSRITFHWPLSPAS